MPSKTFWRRLQDIFARRLFQDVFKTSSRTSLAIMSSRRLEDVLKTSWETKKCYIEDVFKTSSSCLHQDECFLRNDVIEFVLISLLLTLYIFHNFFYCFYYWLWTLWTDNQLLGMTVQIVISFIDQCLAQHGYTAVTNSYHSLEKSKKMIGKCISRLIT